MAKNKNDYFALLENQVSFCVKASALLENIIETYSRETILTRKDEMHEIEHAADSIHHNIHTRLASEFITPIDQEDILHLVQNIDSITDALDEVVLSFYMYGVREIPEDTVTLAKTVNRCVLSLSKAVSELKSFKKPDALRKYLIEVNDIEGEADAVFFKAIHDLFKTCDDTKTLIGTKAIFESLEGCCDLCEHAADIIEQIIIKNT